MPLPIRNEEAEERPVLFILRDMTAPTHVQKKLALNKSKKSAKSIHPHASFADLELGPPSQYHGLNTLIVRSAKVQAAL